MSKRALITGITGQDGSYLAELLLSKGYDVFGLVRRVSTSNVSRIEHILDDVTLVDGDMVDSGSLNRIIRDVTPDEVYNLAAQSFVGSSFEQPVLTYQVNAVGCLNLLEAVRDHSPDSKFYQAGTSEMFGISMAPQHELTPFHPRSPYGVSKVAAHYSVMNYREAYDIFACNGILFNHESPRRGDQFVTKKIAKGVARISKEGGKIMLGNLDAKRDWGFAGDYVEAMHLMLQRKQPSDYVIATNKTWSIRDFLDAAFNHVGIDDWEPHVGIDPRFYRPAEVHELRGDYSKAKRNLMWEPKTSFEELVSMMVDAELSNLD